MRHLLLAASLAACSSPPRAKAAPARPTGSAPAPASTEAELDQLAEGAHVHGFSTRAVYLDDADHPIGARFIHDKTGFTFDYLRIESAPQGFIWVNSFPTSDKGEPHTQEHLLLGKGDRGRRLGNSEAMSLAESSAFTAQWRTAYHFHTVAGPDVYWPVFENHLDALLNPDYTDEEIRREVRNFGVDKADDGTLRLEEKGSVYNEMVRTYEQPDVGMWRAALQLVYGASHPLALESGGYPEAIRTMTPDDIRKFHDAAYHLANMGMVGAYPKAMTLASVLDHTSAILDKEAGRTGKVMTESELPRPAPAAPGTIRVVEYPYSDTANPGPMVLAWPASRQVDGTDASERTLLGLFLDALAGDESTPLYKQLIDRKTRTMELGASGVWSMVSTDQGQPVYIGVNGVKGDKLDDKTIADVRALVLAELARLAKLPDGDPELVAFDARVASRVIDLRRRYDKFLDTPPGFGFRNTSSAWMDHLHELNRTPGFRKSVTMRPALARVERILAAPANPWRDRLKTWGLLESPFGLAAKPSPALRKQLDSERATRVAQEELRLMGVYHTRDAATTLARYEQDYDVQTKRLEDTAKAVDLPSLVASPPMTLDDSLDYKTDDLHVRTFAATFESMTSARVELSFGVVGVLPADDQMFLAALPTLLADAGVIEDGKPIAADEMRERMRKEILELAVHYANNPRTGRIELVVAGAGNGAAEAQHAVAWMSRVMFGVDWRLDNLPRLRDLIDQQLTATHERMLGAEEGWVDDPRDAWRLQRSLEYAHTSSFLTMAHDLERLRWMFEDPADPKVTAEVVAFLGRLAAAKSLPRAQLGELAHALATETPVTTAALAKWLPSGLSARAKPITRDAGKDLQAVLGDLPDDSLAADWSLSCREMAHDLKFGAPAALAKLEEARRAIFATTMARLVVVGSSANQTAIASDLDALTRKIVTPQREARYHAEGTPFRDRLRERVPGAARALFVGLVDPATSSGVIVDYAPATAYSDTGDDAILDYLASNLYTGHGAHSIFMKTWAAGLAYSNGLHPRLADGALDYYAERCPLLPQTLRFVIDQLRKVKPDPNIARYAVATAFGSRVANSFESRAREMAANLADGLTPDVVRGFRTRVLELAKRDDLATALFARMEAVYGKVLPGYGELDRDALYFVIGPDKQLAAYQDYLHAAVGKDATLYRLYPRDFWITAKL